MVVAAARLATRSALITQLLRERAKNTRRHHRCLPPPTYGQRKLLQGYDRRDVGWCGGIFVVPLLQPPLQDYRNFVVFPIPATTPPPPRYSRKARFPCANFPVRETAFSSPSAAPTARACRSLSHAKTATPVTKGINTESDTGSLTQRSLHELEGGCKPVSERAICRVFIRMTSSTAGKQIQPCLWRLVDWKSFKNSFLKKRKIFILSRFRV